MSNFTSGQTWAAGDVVTPAKLLAAIENATLTAEYIAALQGSFVPRGYIDGLILANNTSQPTRDVDVSAGIAKSDDNTATLTLASALTKRTDTAWASGTGNGGMDTGTRPTSGTLHLWLISNGSAVDVLFSISATSPTLPSGYTKKRRIGAVLTDGSAAIRPFVQVGDRFDLLTQVQSLSTSTPATSSTLQTVAVPAGVAVQALLLVSGNRAQSNWEIFVHRPGVTNPARNLWAEGSVNYSQLGAGQFSVTTNASAQIAYKATATSTVTINTTGWIDPRGKDM